MKNKDLLVKYASLIAKTGANIQKGQEVVINASISAYEFIVILIEECYKEGAKSVKVKWSDPLITTLNFKYQSLDTLSKLSKEQETEYKEYVKNLPVQIYIESDSPDALNAIDQIKYSSAFKKLRKKIRKYRDVMDNKYQWVIAGYPSFEWAKTVYPSLNEDEEFNKLLDDILKVSRVYKETDPNEEWLIHDSNLTRRSELLNEMKLIKLIYTSSNGTNFSLELNPEVKWEGGGEYTEKTKVYFNPNIPSEEIFTSPIKGKAEGIVYSTKPLSYNGNLIEDFYLKFKDGKVIEYKAKKGENILKSILDSDPSSKFLGECALIGCDSPINKLGTIFYNTLYDENASCHLALGRGFTNLYPNFENYSLEELDKLGINNSPIHVDFMIGNEDLSIVGIDINGKSHQIFKDGKWTF